MDNKYDWPGRERRNPAKHNPGKFTLDRIREEIIKFSKYLPNNAIILDFGCGEKPYYLFFKDLAKEYIGLDIENSPEKNKNINIIIKQGNKLPFPDEYFDAIISTEVFEHIENIWFYAEELKRVLKINGRAIISAPFTWDYHPYPNDYWRISEDGWHSLFKGFREISFVYDTNTLQTILQSTNLLMLRKGIKCKLIYRFMNYVVSKINYKKGDRNLPSNIFVYLKK
jgi:SAM-dependent methyltransferase